MWEIEDFSLVKAKPGLGREDCQVSREGRGDSADHKAHMSSWVSAEWEAEARFQRAGPRFK